MELKNFQAAELLYRDLLKRNPENHGYYSDLESALNFGEFSKQLKY